MKLPTGLGPSEGAAESVCLLHPFVGKVRCISRLFHVLEEESSARGSSFRGCRAILEPTAYIDHERRVLHSREDLNSWYSNNRTGNHSRCSYRSGRRRCLCPAIKQFVAALDDNLSCVVNYKLACSNDYRSGFHFNNRTFYLYPAELVQHELHAADEHDYHD